MNPFSTPPEAQPLVYYILPPEQVIETPIGPGDLEIEFEFEADLDDDEQ